eukprot:ANDGO_01541.mRNA.1 hypothetical protein
MASRTPNAPGGSGSNPQLYGTPAYGVSSTSNYGGNRSTPASGPSAPSSQTTGLTPTMRHGSVSTPGSGSHSSSSRHVSNPQNTAHHAYQQNTHYSQNAAAYTQVSGAPRPLPQAPPPANAMHPVIRAKLQSILCALESPMVFYPPKDAGAGKQRNESSRAAHVVMDRQGRRHRVWALQQLAGILRGDVAPFATPYHAEEALIDALVPTSWALWDVLSRALAYPASYSFENARKYGGGQDVVLMHAYAYVLWRFSTHDKNYLQHADSQGLAAHGMQLYPYALTAGSFQQAHVMLSAQRDALLRSLLLVRRWCKPGCSTTRCVWDAVLAHLVVAGGVLSGPVELSNELVVAMQVTPTAPTGSSGALGGVSALIEPDDDEVSSLRKLYWSVQRLWARFARRLAGIAVSDFLPFSSVLARTENASAFEKYSRSGVAHDWEPEVLMSPQETWITLGLSALRIALSHPATRPHLLTWASSSPLKPATSSTLLPFLKPSVSGNSDGGPFKVPDSLSKVSGALWPWVLARAFSRLIAVDPIVVSVALGGPSKSPSNVAAFVPTLSLAKAESVVEAVHALYAAVHACRCACAGVGIDADALKVVSMYAHVAGGTSRAVIPGEDDFLAEESLSAEDGVDDLLLAAPARPAATDSSNALCVMEGNKDDHDDIVGSGGSASALAGQQCSAMLYEALLECVGVGCVLDVVEAVLLPVLENLLSLRTSMGPNANPQAVAGATGTIIQSKQGQQNKGQAASQQPQSQTVVINPERAEVALRIASLTDFVCAQWAKRSVGNAGLVERVGMSATARRLSEMSVAVGDRAVSDILGTAMHRLRAVVGSFVPRINHIGTAVSTETPSASSVA